MAFHARVDFPPVDAVGSQSVVHSDCDDSLFLADKIAQRPALRGTIAAVFVASSVFWIGAVAAAAHFIR